MMWNDEGVGGFFEDLPVLAFILTGSLLIISTNVVLAEQKDDMERLESLELSAERLAHLVLVALSEGFRDDVTLESMRALNRSSLPSPSELAGASGWTVSLTVIHPWQELVGVWESGSSAVYAEAGWHCLLFNVSYGQYGVGVAEVVAVVFP